MPKKVVDLLKNYIPKLVCKSNRKGIIEERSIEKLPTTFNKDEIVIVNTQDMKSKIKGSVTSGACGGITVNTVHYVVTDLAMMQQDKIKFVYTAISRATDKLVVYGTKEEIEEFYTILNCPVERALNMEAGIVPYNDTVIEKPDHHYISKDNEAIQTYVIDNNVLDIAGVENILERVYSVRSDNVCNKVLKYTKRVIRENCEQKKVKMSIDYLTQDDAVITGKKIGNSIYNQEFHAKDLLSSLNTAIGRYTKKTPKIPKYRVQSFVDGLSKFLQPCWQYKLGKVTIDELWKNTRDYLKVLQEKFGANFEEEKDKAIRQLVNFILNNDPKHGDHKQQLNAQLNINNANDDIKIKENKVLLDEIEEEQKDPTNDFIIEMMEFVLDSKLYKSVDLEIESFENYHKFVDFHMKRQPKNNLDKDWFTADKNGQGVSAWSKMKNIIFTGMTRSMALRMQLLVKENVQLSYGKSDADLDLFFRKYLPYINNKNYNNFCNDFSEFDTAQDEKGILSSMVLFKTFGYSDNIIAHYYNMRKHWMLSMNNMMSMGEGTSMLARASVEGQWKQHSG